MKAMAFTEHGSVFSWVNKKRHIEKAGMKYIHGEEFYVTKTIEPGEYGAPTKIRDNYHCSLYAKNFEGVKELNQLSSASFNRQDGHYYYAPRITLDELINTSDNIIVSTACLGGILHNGEDDVREVFINFLIQNKHRCFLEIQHHSDAAGEQGAYNKYLFSLSKNTGIPLIAGTDTHALNAEHMVGRAILQKAKKVHFADEDSWDLTFKTYDELVAAYKKQNVLPMEVVLEAIENTNRLADMVEEFPLDESYKYPHLWADSEGTFLRKIEEGIVRRGVDKYPNYQEYRDRIEEELKAYRHNGAIDFMLLMEDILNWCRTQDIQVGYGRGSVNGSVIAWLLGITEMDSIKHNLNFERFMNIERVSLSDIDTDFPPSRIEEVKDYIFSKTGLYCSDIITFNTIADKGAIRDVGRALEIPLDEVDEICKAFESNEEKLRKKYPELFKYVDLVKGVIVSVGSHPCGCIVSPESLTDNAATFTTSTSKYPISQIYMKEVDGLNYVKLDLLRLDTIELINDTCKLAGIQRLTPDNVDINDVAVWNSMRDDSTGIFQWESDTGADYIKKLLSDENIKKFQAVDEHVDRMTLLTIGNSAIRPAGASYRDDLANGVVRKSGSQAIDDFLKPTFGYLVFQCQIIEFLHQYCGFTMGEADIVRRHFAKKVGTDKDIPVIQNGGYMIGLDGEPKKDHYIAGFTETMKKNYGMSPEESEKTITAFLQVIIDASNYLFSLNHSQPYSYEGYVSGWLRYHYPVEFITTALNINVDKEEKTLALTRYAKAHGIQILPPKFRHSKAVYFCNAESREIYKGIGSIKFMNAQVADELYALKDEQFEDFIDLLVAVKKTSCNSRQLQILIELDYFSEFGDVNLLLTINNLFGEVYGKQQIKKDKIPKLGEYITEMDVRQFAGKESEKTFTKVDMFRLLKYLAATIQVPPATIMERISYQKENLGYVDIVDKKYAGLALVMSVNTKWTPWLTLYALANGKTIECKVDKRDYNRQPVKEGDVVRIEGQTYKSKQRKTENGFEAVPGSKVLWITRYRKVVV
jgi:DNA polymerase-3 subunit alpha